jgi:hypothetical protein
MPGQNDMDSVTERVITIQVPGLLGPAYRRYTGTHFETQPAEAGPYKGQDYLLVFEGAQVVALFPPLSWNAAWFEDAVVRQETGESRWIQGKPRETVQNKVDRWNQGVFRTPEDIRARQDAGRHSRGVPGEPV